MRGRRGGSGDGFDRPGPGKHTRTQGLQGPSDTKIPGKTTRTQGLEGPTGILDPQPANSSRLFDDAGLPEWEDIPEEEIAATASAIGVQRLATSEPSVHVAPTAVAARGMSGPAEALPFATQIQASFGRHDISGVESHSDSAATDAGQALGARAYAMGNAVAFASQPDLRTAAHEAAHVVQQRGGVQRAGGVDTPGDVYEQQADEAADAVVAGRSAEPILDRAAPAHGSGTAVVQRNHDETGKSNTNLPAAQPDPAQPTKSDSVDVRSALANAEHANALIESLKATFLPAFRAAVDALNPAVVKEYGTHCVGSYIALARMRKQVAVAKQHVDA